MKGASLEVMVERERVAGANANAGNVLPIPDAHACPLEAVGDDLASPLDVIVAAWMRLRELWSAMLAIVGVMAVCTAWKKWTLSR